MTAYLANGMDLVNSVINAREMIQRSIASMYSVGKGERVVNSAVNMRQAYQGNEVIRGMGAVIDSVIDIIPVSWVPPAGMNIAYAAACAERVDDVAAVKGRITVVNGRPRRNGPVMFGAAEHISHVILAAMGYDRNVRAAVNMAYRDDLLNVMEEVGMSIARADRKRHRNASLGELTAYAIDGFGSVPDVIYDPGDGENPSMIRMLGRDPEDLKEKIESIL